MNLIDVRNTTVYKEFKRHCREVGEKIDFSDRTSVSDGPTGQTTNCEIRLKIRPDYSYKNLCFYGLLTYYLPQEYQTYVRVLLREQFSRKISNLQKRERFNSLLWNDIELAEQIFLFEFNTPSELFGWIIQQENPRFQIFYRKNQDLNLTLPPNRSRHRGYRDKGSLGKNSISPTDLNKDVWLLEAEDVLEQEIKISRDLTTFILETNIFDL